MNGALLLRRRLARPVAAGLAVVFLALSAAAGFHQGDHDVFGWLPERFHKHDFRWAVEADGAKSPLAGHCLACHLGRTLVRLVPPPPALPDAPAPVFAGAPGADSQAPERTDFLSAPRAPPAS
ncbi:MAG TPA: hypothetical protein VFM44_05950 [Gemmatimonadota bacterium]|nr:hypothetical protein [Gemmatimonadota bacterium]